MKPAAIAIALVLAAGPASGPAAGADLPTVTIGVRTDARPFAWKAEESLVTYRGYLVDICFDATTRAGYHFTPVDVTAADRDTILDGTFSVDGEAGATPIDLLCDPTTITLGRLDQLARDQRSRDAVFTPIVYVANGSYVRQADKAAQAACPGAAAAAADAEAGATPPSACATEFEPASCIAPRGRDPGEATEYLVAATVVGTTAQATARRAVLNGQLALGANQKVCIVTVPDHRDGVRQFCGKEFHFYFGDLDIIRAYAVLATESGTKCELARAERPLSYEPYALLVTSEDAEYRARFIAAVYEIFSDGTASGRFDAYFPGHVKSSALSLLYRINSIPGLRETGEPPDEPPGAGAAPASAPDKQATAEERPRAQHAEAGSTP